MEIEKHKPSNAMTAANFLMAMNEPKILELPNAGIELGKLITETYLVKGQTIPNDDLIIQATKLFEEIRDVFPTATMGEIRMAFFHGVRGSFGEYIGLNVVTYHQWIKALLNDDLRGKIINARNALVKPEERIPTEQEQDAMYRKQISESFEQFKSTGKIRDYGNLIYHYLDKHGKMEIPADKKWEFMDRAKQYKVRELREQSLDPAEKFGKKIDAQNFLERIEQNRITQNDKAALVIEAKNLAVNWWFGKLVEQNQNPL